MLTQELAGSVGSDSAHVLCAQDGTEVLGRCQCTYFEDSLKKEEPGVALQ